MNQIRQLSFCFFLILSFSVEAQQKQIDSTLKVIKSAPEDTSKVNALNFVARQYYLLDDTVNALGYLRQALALAKKSRFDKGIVTAYIHFGFFYQRNENYTRALDYYLNALKQSEESGSKQDIARTCMSLSKFYMRLDNHQKGIDYCLMSIKNYKEINATKDLAYAYGQLAEIYEEDKNYDLAKTNLLLALEISKERKDTFQMGTYYESLGDLYVEIKDYKKALESHLLSLKASRDLNDQKGVADSYQDIGRIYLSEKKYQHALENHLSALEIYKGLKTNNGMPLVAMCLAEIGDIYLKLNDPTKALECYHAALKLVENITNKRYLLYSYHLIAKAYGTARDYKNALLYVNKMVTASAKYKSADALENAYKDLVGISVEQNDYKKAFEYQARYSDVKDSINNLTEKGSTDMQKQHERFEFEKTQKEREVNDLKLSQKELELKQSKTIRLSLFAFSALILVFAGFMFNRFRVTQKQKVIIEARSKETEIQKHLVEEKQKEIIDSITYAKRLQDAILPPPEFVNAYLPENFILYKPKDIVAGDFYWAELMDGNFYIAAADSTGHGVPGALVSVVCSNALHRAVKEFQENSPGAILDRTRELVIQTFEKSRSEVKDGMDISLMCFNLTEKKITWSGANNPLWYFKENQLTEIKADKQAIGVTDYPKPFTTHTIDWTSGTTFFLFTDGFADQFGGPMGKKFKYKQFSEFLKQNISLSMQEQSEGIGAIFETWKGDLEQVDDVCVIGIRI